MTEAYNTGWMGDPLNSCYYQQTPHVKSGCNYHRHKQTTRSSHFKYAQNLHKYDITVKWRSFTFVWFMTLQSPVSVHQKTPNLTLAWIYQQNQIVFHDLNWFLPYIFIVCTCRTNKLHIYLQHLVSSNLFACFTMFLFGLWLLEQMPWVEEDASDFNIYTLINVNSLPL